MKILNPVTTPEGPRTQNLYRMGFVVMALLVVWVQTIRFDDQNYREDEINTVHGVQVLSYAEIAQWLALEGTHPPGWRWTYKFWIDAFGSSPDITRFQSTLLTLLGMALIYRLGADLFDHQVGFLALCLLGLQPFFHWHTHEVRPYAMLLMWTAAMHVVFLHWLRHQTWPYALGFVVCGVLGFQTHYFMAYVVAAQALVALTLIRYEKLTYWRGFGLHVAIGLSFTAWVLPILYGAFVARPKGINYDFLLRTNPEGIRTFLQNMQFLPVLFLPALLIPMASVYTYRVQRITPMDTRWRVGEEWPRWYAIGLAVGMIVLPFMMGLLINHVTDRNMIIITPILGVLGDYLLRALTPRWRIGAVGSIVGIGLFVFHPYYQNVPYQSMFDFMARDFEPQTDVVVTTISRANAGTTEMVYMMIEEWQGEGFEKTQIFSIAETYVFARQLRDPDPLANLYEDTTPETLAAFDMFLADHGHFWYITYTWEEFYGISALARFYEGRISCDFVEVQRRDFPVDHRGKHLGTYTVIEFERRPTSRCQILG